MSKLDDFINGSIDFAPSIKLNKTFNFDESNNIKKGIIGKNKDNNADLENLYFVLGGIATKEPLNFEELLKYAGVKQMPVDAKFNFFAFKKNKFTDVIAQSRLRKFFELMNTPEDESSVCFKKFTPMFIKRRFRLMLKLIMRRNK